MARRPARLWRVPAFVPYVQPPLTAAAMRAAEHDLGVTLPDAYVSMLTGRGARRNLTTDHPGHRASLVAHRGLAGRRLAAVGRGAIIRRAGG
jgi:hypothetical protein